MDQWPSSTFSCAGRTSTKDRLSRSSHFGNHAQFDQQRKLYCPVIRRYQLYPNACGGYGLALKSRRHPILNTKGFGNRGDGGRIFHLPILGGITITMENSLNTLTTFPVVFPDEEEKGHIISSLFSKVRSKFGATSPGNEGSSSWLPGGGGSGGGGGDGTTGRGGRDALGESEGQPGSRLRPDMGKGKGSSLMPSPLRISTALTPDESIGSSSSSPTAANPIQSRQRSSNVTDDSYPPSIQQASIHSDRLMNRPSFTRSMTVRDPAPAVLSTTPVVRSQDWAHMHTGEGNFTRNRRDSNASQFSNHPSASLPHHHHIKNLSASNGYNRVRRLSSSGLSTSPSSSNLSASALEQLDLSHIPGFSIADDARSIRTDEGLKRNGSVTKIIRRLRGEGLSKQYWMADENCKECYDCKSVFSTWRRKHHCRICGQIFCSRCAPNIIKGECGFCFSVKKRFS